MVPNGPVASHLEQVSLVLYIPYITVLYHSPVAWWKSVIQTILKEYYSYCTFCQCEFGEWLRPPATAQVESNAQITWETCCSFGSNFQHKARTAVTGLWRCTAYPCWRSAFKISLNLRLWRSSCFTVWPCSFLPSRCFRRKAFVSEFWRIFCRVWARAPAHAPGQTLAANMGMKDMPRMPRKRGLGCWNHGMPFFGHWNCFDLLCLMGMSSSWQVPCFSPWRPQRCSRGVGKNWKKCGCKGAKKRYIFFDSYFSLP